MDIEIEYRGKVIDEIDKIHNIEYITKKWIEMYNYIMSIDHDFEYKHNSLITKIFGKLDKKQHMALSISLSLAMNFILT